MNGRAPNARQKKYYYLALSAIYFYDDHKNRQ